ncbi:MAG: ABC transporter permease [Candidatus Limnocylindrales bacterium]
MAEQPSEGAITAPADGLGAPGGFLRRWWPALPAGLGLVLLFLIPMAILALYSLWRINRNLLIVVDWNFDNYATFFGEGTYLRTFAKTIVVAVIATAATVAAALPFAYFIVRYVSRAWQRVVLLGVIIPFWSSYLLRAYSWQSILGEKGVVNGALQTIGLINAPITFFNYTNSAVVLVLVYVYLPFAVLAIYASLEKFDFGLVTAAQDLGASPLRAWRHVLLPSIRPGLITACIFVFIPILGEYLTPTLVGGVEGTLIANLIINFERGGQYPLAAAASFLIAAVVTVLLVVFRRYLRVQDVVGRV